MMTTRFDAIIVGAGPAGSSAAILLATAGWSVALIERQHFPRRKVCGECIAASVLPLLHELGIGQAADALAGPELRQVALMYRADSVLAPLPAFNHPLHRWGRALDREHLDALLLARARQAGATLFQPWIACEVGGTPGNFFCRIRAEHQDATDGAGPAHAANTAHAADASRVSARLTAPVLIAAHGSWSGFRGLDAADALSPPESLRARPRASDLFAFKANFAEATLQPGIVTVLAFAGGYGGMVLGQGGMATVACCLRRDRLAACRLQTPGAPAGEAVEVLLKQSCHGVRDALLSAGRGEKWLSVGPIRPGVRLSGRAGGAFLIGNAAAEAHPVIGEGISMALQSACLLAAGLIHARDADGTLSSALLETVRTDYALAWRARFGQRLVAACALAQLAMRPQAAILLPLIKAFPAVLAHAARISGKVRPAVAAPLLPRPAGPGGAAIANAADNARATAPGRFGTVPTTQDIAP